MPTGQQYATNVPQTTLTGSINAVAASLSVASSSGWPATPFTACLDIGTSTQEPVDVTAVVGTTWTVTRNIDGTTGFSHAIGATVTHADIGRDFREARTHMDASTAVHGVAGAVVGTTDSQTLTNKTLTAPAISTISNAGTLTLPTGPETLVGRATTDTLTNKTLTSPIFSTIVNTGTLTLPTSTDTLVGRATTDTLTNKTLTSPTINTPTLVGSGGTLTLPAGPEALVGSGHFLTGGGAAGGSVNFTTTTEADVSTSATFSTTHANATLFVWANFDMQVITNGTGVGLGFITVDGTDMPAQAIFAMTTTGLRSVVNQNALVTLAGTGSHSIKLRGALSANSGSLTFNGTHTRFVYLVLDF